MQFIDVCMIIHYYCMYYIIVYIYDDMGTVPFVSLFIPMHNLPIFFYISSTLRLFGRNALSDKTAQSAPSYT